MTPDSMLVNEKQRRLEQLRYQKEQLVDRYNEIVQDYERGVISEFEYNLNMQRLLKGNSVHDYLAYYNDEIKKQEKAVRRSEGGNVGARAVMAVAVLMFVLLLGFAVFNPELTGQYINTMDTGDSAALSCEVTDACVYNDILHMANITDSHAELANGSDYGYSLCCRDLGPNNVTIGTASSGEEYLHLSNVTDAHVEKATENYYNYKAFISSDNASITCSYKNTCENYDTCLVSISTNITGNDTNLHIADCVTDPYATLVCCNMTYDKETVAPESSNFTSDMSTNFSEVDDLMNVTNLTLGNEKGLIKFPEGYGVHAENEDYDSNIIIGDNFISVDTANLHESFNSTATLTIFNVSFTDPLVFRDNSLCEDCEIISNNVSGKYTVFNVSHFTNYTLKEDVNLTVYDDTDSLVKRAEEMVGVYAEFEYSNGSSINSTSSCRVEFNDSISDMTFNSTEDRWVYNRTFDKKGLYEFNVSCSAHLNLSASDQVEISNTVPDVPTQFFPGDGNETKERKVLLNWSSNDIDDDNITYDLIIHRIYCNDPEYCSVSMINETNLTVPEYTTTLLDVDAAYNWSVRAYDGSSYSNWSSVRNFTVIPEISIDIYNEEIYFGEFNRSAPMLNTSSLGLGPMQIENDGNVFVNLKIKALDSIFESVGLGTEYFQFRAYESSETGSFNLSGSATSWTNMPVNYTKLADKVDFNNTRDLVNIGLGVKVPHDEPPGKKESTIIVEAEQW